MLYPMRQHRRPRLLCLYLPVSCAGDLDGVAYLQKYTTLEHMQADQVAKLQSDIIYRRLLEVSEAVWMAVCCSATASMSL